MTRTGHALLAWLLLLTISVSDLWVTLYFNPSLSSEANPLVAQLGLERSGLIVSNAVIVALIGLGLWIYRQRPRGIPPLPARDPWAYAGVSLYRRQMTRLEFWRAFLLCWPLPSNGHQFFRFAGFFTAWAVVVARASAVFAWFANEELEWSWYLDIREAIAIGGYPCLELFIGLAFGVAMIPVLVHSEYRLDHPERTAPSSSGHDDLR
jgi:hypothetical protein